MPWNAAPGPVAEERNSAYSTVGFGHPDGETSDATGMQEQRAQGSRPNQLSEEDLVRLVREEGVTLRTGGRVLSLRLEGETDVSVDDETRRQQEEELQQRRSEVEAELDRRRQEVVEEIRLRRQELDQREQRIEQTVQERVRQQVGQISEMTGRMQQNMQHREQRLQEQLNRQVSMPDLTFEDAESGISVTKDRHGNLLWLVAGLYWVETIDHQRINERTQYETATPIYICIFTEGSQVVNVTTRKTSNFQPFPHYHKMDWRGGDRDCWGRWLFAGTYNGVSDIYELARQAFGVLSNVNTGSLAAANPTNLPTKQRLQNNKVSVTGERAPTSTQKKFVERIAGEHVRRRTSRQPNAMWRA